MGATRPNPRSSAATLALVVGLLGSACATRPAAAPRAVAPSVAPVAAPTAASDGEGEAEEPEDASEAANDTDPPRAESEASGPCPVDMVLVEMAAPTPRRFCVDKYEASLVEVLADGSEKPFPHYQPVDGHDVRAVSRARAFPQGYISEVQAQDACGASGKRLCNHDEWKTACMGPAHTTFPYGDARRPGACHDTGKSAVVAVFGAKAVMASTPMAPAAPVSSPVKHAHATKGRAAQTTKSRAAVASKGPTKGHPTRPVPKKGVRRTGKKSTRPASVDPGVWAKLNDPALGQVDGALSKTGEHAECVNGFGAFDMVGNLHEWVATDPAAVHGTFAGGYYLDTTINGDGCNYRTVAHAHEYHDYSTGFRCCSGAAPPSP
jgi:hypothetical protein